MWADQIDRSADQSTWPHGSSISVSMTAMTLFSCNWYSDTEVKLKNFCLLLQIRKRFCLHLNSVEKHIKERKTTDILICPLFPTFWIIAVLGFVFTNYRIERGGETKALQIKPFVFDLTSDWQISGNPIWSRFYMYDRFHISEIYYLLWFFYFNLQNF